ncbi:MAG: hypothetical protein E7508_08335 [Ruminococcus sp.]|nr:hypothetical protein [Ruminococcus sp.]
MKNGKKFGLTIFQVVLSIVLIALIIFSVGVNYIFGSSMKSGSVFGKNIYVMNTDLMDSEGGIPEGAAVIGDSNETAVLTEGNVILFSETAEVENVMRIVEVVHNTDNTVYRVAADNASDNILNVPKENVIAKCTVQSEKLGSVITFLKSMAGILVGMIIPCLILLVMLIFKILSVKRSEREENNIVYPETFGIGSNTNELRDHSANPLFDPSMAPKPDASFEMKKSSIAENFTMKPAAKRNMSSDPSARNLQTESAVEKFRAAVDEKPPAPVSRKASLAPNAPVSDREEKMAAIKAALNESENVQTPVQNAMNAEKTTAFTVPNAAQEPVQKPVAPVQPSVQPVAPQPAPAPAPKPAARKQDNINSIDDLIKALEEEKKKL